MKKYFLNDLNFERKDAGFKARSDALRIAEQRGDIIINHIPLWGGIKSRINYTPRLIRFLLSLSSNDILIFNFPVARPFWYVLSFFHGLRKFKMVPLIHDIDSLRGGKNIDIRRLFECDFLISHNSMMTSYLSQSIQKEKIKEIGIFDYLIESVVDKETNNIAADKGIIYAGNLARHKCEFIYGREQELYLFGVNYEIKDDPYYMGSFNSGQPFKLVAEGVFFGLIWDGESSNTCSGHFGEYLKFNNPHKTSLYLSMGIPVFIWKNAALAKFIEENDVGFAVSSLSEAQNILHHIDFNRYAQIKANAYEVSEKIKSGFYLNRVLNEVFDDA